MTAAATIADPVEFRRHLPRHIASQLHDTQKLAALLGRALTQGWDLKHLAAECSRNLEGTANAGGVVMYRLDKAAAHPPPNKPAKTARRPLCPRCEDGWLVDEHTRKPTARCTCRTAPTTTRPGRTPA